MARIVVGSYMVRYPLGGMLSYVLQYLVGFQRLGHEVYFAEKAGYPNSCYDPVKKVMGDDCAYGARTVNDLLARFELQDRWCYVDAGARYHGLSRSQIEDVFKTADLFLDMGTHGAWLNEATAGARVLLDGEPGYTQMKMQNRLADGEQLPRYDYYYTAGPNIGTARSSTPTAGRTWHHVWHPIVMDHAGPPPPSAAAGRFTTVMNWQSHDRIEFDGQMFGQKDIEFERFFELPRRTAAPMEVAVAGTTAPRQRLTQAGWTVSDAHSVTTSFDSFWNYIRRSRGEFSVCKHVFVATNSGWFSDRSGAYLASGRPVILQDTGFSAHLPCGEGLIAVRTMEEAAEALDEVTKDYARHSNRAREIAWERLEATKVLGKFLEEIGIEAGRPFEHARLAART
jgi:hypothetical protein